MPSRVAIRLPLLLVLTCLALVGAGCAGDRTSDRDLVFVNPGEADEILGGRRGLLGLGGEREVRWLDPRSRADFVSGHIPGAMHVPIETLRIERARLDGADTIIVYGDGFDNALAAATSKLLLEMGFQDVRTLRGGLRAWTDAGREIEKGG